MVMLGFLGSFGHCLGMCGPLTAAFALSDREQSWRSRLAFTLWLNLGRLLSYALVGVAIGSVSSLLVAGGQLAGVGSDVRRILAIATGGLLVWMGLLQIQPRWLPQTAQLPGLAGIQRSLHDFFSHWMQRLTLASPVILGLLWGLMPCGFLYTAQIKAIETGHPIAGGGMMLAFGLGTLPMMLGIAVSTNWLSRDRRSQLFRLGGWVTVTIGVLTLLRNSEMTDYTGHAALICLMLALIARPISRWWPGPLQYRRGLGVGAFLLALLHVLHSLSHSLNWQLESIWFLMPMQQMGLWAGILATLCLLPPAVTSFDYWVRVLGDRWRTIHLLTIPALLLTAFHAIFLGSSYWGTLTPLVVNHLRVAVLILGLLAVLLLRSAAFWSWMGWKEIYVKPK